LSKILRPQCTVYSPSKCQISAKPAKANNSHNGFCEVTPKHFSFISLWITSDTEDLKLKCFGVTSQKLL